MSKTARLALTLAAGPVAVIAAVAAAATLDRTPPAGPTAAPAFPLAVAPGRRHLVDATGKPFFVMGDTPWFLQKVPIAEVRRIMDDRKAKGYNTLFLELLDDSVIPSRDAHGNLSFDPPTDITRPVEAYWRYADEVMAEAERRGFFVIMSELWYGAGKGLWMHHVKPEAAKVYGHFVGKRYARFTNLMWMHAGDRNPDDNLLACTRALATAIKAEAPHQLHTVHNAAEFASAAFHHQDRWLDVDMGYTYGASYLQILPEYQRKDPVRPVVLGETGYEDEPNAIERLPDGKPGEIWNPYRVRRNAWWAVLSGATGFCNGTKLWRWEKNWRDQLDVASTRQTPLVLRLLESIAWWRLAPDTRHAFVTHGFGEWKKASYAAVALADDGSAGVVYVPDARTFTVDLAKLRGPAVARWFDPAGGGWKPADRAPVAGKEPRSFTSPGKNAAGDDDWVLLLEAKRS